VTFEEDGQNESSRNLQSFWMLVNSKIWGRFPNIHFNQRNVSKTLFLLTIVGLIFS
ncbi:hypothetical protein SCG7086_AT_00010, partial [Chlamydiales bacterium SCGC AG-110-P3]